MISFELSILLISTLLITVFKVIYPVIFIFISFILVFYHHYKISYTWSELNSREKFRNIVRKRNASSEYNIIQKISKLIEHQRVVCNKGHIIISRHFKRTEFWSFSLAELIVYIQQKAFQFCKNNIILQFYTANCAHL